MPRSTDPRNYGPFYEKLSLLMDAGEQDIRLRMSGKLAIYHRNNFYAYINALKHESSQAFKRKTLDAVEQLELSERAAYMEGVLRRYLVVLTPDDTNAEDVELRFVLRGMDERQKPGIQQLDQLIESTRAVERVEEHHKLLKKLTTGSMDFKALHDIRKESPISHFFEGVKTQVDEDMTDELADTILSSDPIDRTDLTDLVTPSNQAEEPTTTLRDKAMQGAEKLRESEKKT